MSEASCPPEWRYSVYVDGELEPEGVRLLETHLIGCRRCRERVVALRDEARLLSDALHERELPSLRPAEDAAPARGFALGLVPTLAISLVGLSALGWLLEAKVPGALAWLNPLGITGITGVFDVAFDLIFLLRDRVPGLLELVVSAAAMLSVSALLTVALSAFTRRIGGPVLLSLGWPLLLMAPLAGAPAPARALDLRFDQREVVVPEGETLRESLVVSGERVRIEGVVEGDLAVLAERVAVTGQVEGNVFASGRDVTVEGVVKGSLFAFAERVEVHGQVEGSVYTGAEHYRLERAGKVGRDAVHGGYGAVVEGEVGRDLAFFGEWAELRGRVGRDLEARVERLALLDGAQVGRDVTAVFHGPDENLERAPGARVDGEIVTSLFERPRHDRWRSYADAGFYVMLALHLAAAFSVGMLLYWLAPGLFRLRLATVGEFFAALGWGALVVLVTPVALLLAALTLVGIPLAVLGLFVFVTALYVAGIVVAALLGRTLVRPAPEDPAGGRAFALTLLAGLVVLVVATHLPWVGGIVRAVALLTGLGLLFGRARSAWDARRARA